MADFVDIRTDVLIIGGGSAGLWCARQAKLEAPELDVLVVDKCRRDWGGLMSLSGGDLEVLMPGEDAGEWVRDLVYYWDGLCDQSLMEEIWKGSYETFDIYRSLGLEFFDAPDGGFRSVPQRNLPHIRLYPYKYKGTGGAAMAGAVTSEVERLGVERMGRVCITELVRKNGAVCGAYGFDVISGQNYRFIARAVVMAAGQAAYKPSYNNCTCTGEGIIQAYEAGARLRNMEFINVWNVPKLFAWEGQTVLMPLGAKFVNSEGETVMRNYSPVLGSNTDPHYLTRAMTLEILAGRGPITLDMSAIKEEDRVLIKPQTGNQLLHYNKLLDAGVKFFEDKLEWIPQIQLMVGGIDADVDGRTGVPGLFAAGRCRSIDPGVYMGGFALMSTSVTGRRAGTAAVKYASESAPRETLPSPEHPERLVGAPVPGPLTARGVLVDIQSEVAPYDVTILKTAGGLARAAAATEEIISEKLPLIGAENPHYLSKKLETEAIARFSSLYLKAAAFREESRGGHFRADFPQRNDDWLCWVTLSEKDGRAVAEKRPVPVESYKYPVDRFYSDNFTF